MRTKVRGRSGLYPLMRCVSVYARGQGSRRRFVRGRLWIRIQRLCLWGTPLNAFPKRRTPEGAKSYRRGVFECCRAIQPVDCEGQTDRPYPHDG